MNDIAQQLIGYQLEGGWTIRRMRPALYAGSGGGSCCTFYASNATGAEAFVKVLDVRLDPQHPEPTQDLQVRLERFNYESDIVLKCASERLSRVAHGMGRGYITLGNGSVFPYLIFERAEGDLREQIQKAQHLGAPTCFRVLHNVATAIQQLHWRRIAHQDLKPSNVLDFKQHGHKVGDFGSAHQQSITRPGQQSLVAGDPTYAPPEQLYQYATDDWLLRRLMADVYHLGSLALFLFTGDGATTQLGRQLDTPHHWYVWTGSRDDLMPYLRCATTNLLQRIRPSDTSLNAEQHAEFLQLMRCLLEPDPALRGHPHDRAEGVLNGMQRFISKFNVYALASRVNQRLAKTA